MTSYIGIQHSPDVHLVLGRIELRVTPQVTPHNELRKQLVLHGVRQVLDHTQHIETGQNRLRELDVLLERDRRVVAAADGVRRGDDRAPRLQRRHDARLRDRDRLLLHRLVDRRPVRVVHLVELVDETGTLVGEDQRTALERPLARNRVFADARSETDCGSTLTCCEHGPVCGFLDILEELRFCCTRVTKQKDIDITTNTVLSVDVLGNTAEEREGKGSLDILVTVNGGCDRLDDALANPIVSSESTDFFLILFSKAEGSELVFLLVDVVGLQDR